MNKQQHQVKVGAGRSGCAVCEGDDGWALEAGGQARGVLMGSVIGLDRGFFEELVENITCLSVPGPRANSFSRLTAAPSRTGTGTEARAAPENPAHQNRGNSSFPEEAAERQQRLRDQPGAAAGTGRATLPPLSHSRGTAG